MQWTRRRAIKAVVGLSMLAAMACTKAAGFQLGQKQPDPKEGGASPAGSGALASKASQDAKFFAYVETLTADRPSIYGYLAARGCAPSGVFRRGERMVWRFEVLDVSTGKTVTSEEASTVLLRLPFLVDEKAIFKQRGDGHVLDAPWTWEVCWDVPLDYPMGSLDYSIAVTMKDGRRGEWKPPAFVDPSRGVDTRPQIIAS